jgi:hypothetical protein
VTEKEALAERHLRRGEWARALELFVALAEEFPANPAFAQKAQHIRDNLQPSELTHPKARAPGAEVVSALTPEQEGERRFSLGDYAGAAACYRRALRDKPQSELIQERLAELFALAQVAPTARPEPEALPREREPRLKELLERIASRKRPSTE